MQKVECIIGALALAFTLAGCAEKSEASNIYNISVNTDQCSHNEILEEQRLLCNQYAKGRMSGFSAIVDRLGKPHQPPAGSPLALEMLSVLSKARKENEKMVFGRQEGSKMRLFEKPAPLNNEEAISQILADQAYYRTGVLSALQEYCASDSGKKQIQISCTKPREFLSLTEQIMEAQSLALPWNRR